MTMNMLVAYAGKNGSTEEIAHWLADTLNDSGVSAVARPAALEGAPEQYDAVVLGSALYAGRWQRPALRFAHRHAEMLAAKPLWLFSSGPWTPPRPRRICRRCAVSRGSRSVCTRAGMSPSAAGWSKAPRAGSPG